MERIADKDAVTAVAYMRTSSATNVGADKDSERRQRAAIEGYAKRANMSVADWFYDPAVEPVGGNRYAGSLALLKIVLEVVADTFHDC